MKKTIAILLVLVIGMVGVWALTGDTAAKTATLTLTTSVDPYTMLAITQYDDTTYVFGTDTASTEAEFDASAAFGSAALAANLHYRTNITAAPQISVSAKALQNEDDDTFMPFTLTVGEASINPVDDTLVSDNIFGTTTTVATLTDTTLPINVLITGTDLDDYTAGGYATTVTFTFIAL